MKYVNNSGITVCLLSLLAVVLGGCVTPEKVKPVARTAVVKPGNTFVIRRASVRTPGSDRLRLQQQARRHAIVAQARQKAYRDRRTQHVAKQKASAPQKPASHVSVQRARQQDLKRRQHQARYQARQLAAKAAKARPANVKSLGAQRRARQLAAANAVKVRTASVKSLGTQRRARQLAAANAVKVRTASVKSLGTQRRARQLAAANAVKVRTASVKSLGTQRRALTKAPVKASRQPNKQLALRQQHVTKWQQQQAKRRQHNANWQRQQKQQLALAAQRKRPRPARTAAVKRAAPSVVTRKSTPRPDPRQKYLARWKQARAEKRLAAKQARAEKRLAAKQAQAEKRLAAKQAVQTVERVINNAKQQIGSKYVWGGASPKTGFDCSGLVQHSMKAGANIKIPRTAAEQYKAAVKVPADQALRGDLIFFKTRGKHVSHVGIYLGDNKFVHAPRTGRRITTSKLSSYWKKRFVGFGRIPGACRVPM